MIRRSNNKVDFNSGSLPHSCLSIAGILRGEFDIVISTMLYLITGAYIDIRG